MRWRQGWKKIQERSRKKLCNSAIAEQRQPFPVVYNKTVRKKTKKEVRVLGQKEILMECALYIRSHAKEPLSVQGLSNRFGYSACHFSRMFRAEMGVTLMDYVKQQRLFGAAREIREGRKILDAALDYGYETHSGFTRAFRAQFGYSPALLRAFRVGEAFEKGDWVNMGIYLRNTPVHAQPEELYGMLFEVLGEAGTAYGRGNVEAVYELAERVYEGKKRRSGDEYVTHPLNTAIILADMGADEDTVCAGLLHDVWEMADEPETYLSDPAVTPAVKEILNEYREFDKYASCDERVVLVALADRLHNMRTIDFVDPATWEERAKMTLEVFGPMAAECGKVKCRMEFDDLAEKYLSKYGPAL